MASRRRGFVPTIPPGHPLARGLEFLYPMEEGTGLSILDRKRLVRSTHAGSVSVPSWVVGRFGKNFKCDGDGGSDDGRIDTGYTGFTNGDWTIVSHFVMPATAGNTYPKLYTKQNAGAAVIQIEKNPDGAFGATNLRANVSGAAGTVELDVSPEVPHCAILRLTGTALDFIIDNHMRASTTLSTPSFGTEALLLANRGDFARPWNGQLGPLFGYSRALKDAEIDELIHEPLEWLAPPQIYYWLGDSVEATAQILNETVQVSEGLVVSLTNAISVQIDGFAGSATMDPCPYFFTCKNTTVTSGDIRLTADIMWTITDSGDNEVWSARGFNMAYVFETAGTFTVACFVRDDAGIIGSNSVEVTINAFSGTIRYMSSAGSDSNDGTTEANAWLTLGKAVTETNAAITASANARFKLRWRNTDTWNVTTTQGITGTVNSHASTGGLIVWESFNFSTDTVQAGAELHMNTTGVNFFTINGATSSFRFRDMELSGSSHSGLDGAHGILVDGDDFAIIRGSVHDFQDRCVLQAHLVGDVGHTYWYCEIYNAGRYCLYGGGTRSALVGCTIHDGWEATFFGLVRMNSIFDSVYWDCTMYRGDGLSSVAYVALNHNLDADGISQNIYVGACDFKCMVSIGQNSGGEDYPGIPQYLMIEDTTIRQIDQAGLDPAYLQQYSGIEYTGSEFTFRNIEFLGSTASTSDKSYTCFTNTIGSSAMRNQTNIRIYNCSGYKGDFGNVLAGDDNAEYCRFWHGSNAFGKMRELTIINCAYHHEEGGNGGDGQFIEVASSYDIATYYTGENNLFYAPEDAGTWARVSGTRYTLAGFRTAFGSGLETGSIVDTNPLFTSTTDLRPATGSPLINAGMVVPAVYRDIQGIVRDASPTIGAYESSTASLVPVLNETVQVSEGLVAALTTITADARIVNETVQVSEGVLAVLATVAQSQVLNETVQVSEGLIQVVADAGSLGQLIEIVNVSENLVPALTTVYAAQSSSISDEFIRYYLRGLGQAIAPPANVYLALFNGDPKSGGVELTGVSRVVASWTAPSVVGSHVRTSLSSPVSLAGWPGAASANHWALFFSATGGSPVFSGALSQRLDVDNSNPADFAAGALHLDERFGLGYRSQAWATEIINVYLRAQSRTITMAAAPYLALFNGDPNSGGVEITADGITPRKLITFGAPTNISGGRRATNAAAVTWPTWASAPVTTTHFAIYNALSAGIMLSSRAWDVGYAIAAGSTNRVSAGAISWNER